LPIPTAGLDIMMLQQVPAVITILRILHVLKLRHHYTVTRFGYVARQRTDTQHNCGKS
jgi:hypothetical protein